MSWWGSLTSYLPGAEKRQETVRRTEQQQVIQNQETRTSFIHDLEIERAKQNRALTKVNARIEEAKQRKASKQEAMPLLQERAMLVQQVTRLDAQLANARGQSVIIGGAQASVAAAEATRLGAAGMNQVSEKLNRTDIQRDVRSFRSATRRVQESSKMLADPNLMGFDEFIDMNAVTSELDDWGAEPPTSITGPTHLYKEEEEEQEQEVFAPPIGNEEGVFN